MKKKKRRNGRYGCKQTKKKKEKIQQTTLYST